MGDCVAVCVAVGVGVREELGDCDALADAVALPTNDRLGAEDRVAPIDTLLPRTREGVKEAPREPVKVVLRDVVSLPKNVALST